MHRLPLHARATLGLAAALLGTGCLAPALAPIRPMTADAAVMSGDREISATLGYAAAPGAGLGDSVIPGTPYADAELRWALVPRFQLTFGAGFAFQRYFMPWLSSLSLGGKVTAYQDEDVAIAFAPRVVGASAFNLFTTDPDDDSLSRSVFGTRSLGFEVPVLVTHRFSNGWALTLQLWARDHFLRQEDATVNASSGTGSGSGSNLSPVQPAVDTGHTWGAGGAVQFSFPKVRGSSTRYHVFAGLERLWLTQTSASGGTSTNASPLVTLDRFSFVCGLGMTYPW